MGLKYRSRDVRIMSHIFGRAMCSVGAGLRAGRTPVKKTSLMSVSVKLRGHSNLNKDTTVT